LLTNLHSETFDRGMLSLLLTITSEVFGYLYLPRLRDTGVLIEAIRDGLTFTTWEKETFAFAESYDDKAKRYAGLKGGQNVNVPDDGLFGILVRPEIAFAQITADAQPVASSPGSAALAAVEFGGELVACINQVPGLNQLKFAQSGRVRNFHSGEPG
jgi:hypothetical protein